jgi:3-phenylpropionate/trans-cinnamate dioxygenase ferredoxin reductase component
MSSAGVVIVGGGLAGQRCAETLRRRGYDGRITMVCAEPVPPYDRPPLSKDLLAGAAEEESIWLRPQRWYADNEVELMLGLMGVRLDAGAHFLVVSGGRRIPYDRLLVATGSRPRELPFLRGYRNVHTVRTLADVRRLRSQLVPGARLAIVGAGFIGQEIASTALHLGLDVTMLEAQPVPLAGILGERVGEWFGELHRSEGVKVLAPAMLERARGTGRVEELILTDGRSIECDVVVVGVGVAPEMSWLNGTGLVADIGIPTSPAGRTALPDVYAAGDVAAVFDPRLGTHLRTEHWDTAARGGAAAARAMLGDHAEAPPLPSFWSDQHGLRVSYVGHAARADGHRIEGDPSSREFTAIYERGGSPVAALTVGQPRRLAEVRRLIELSHGSQVPEPKEKAA